MDGMGGVGSDCPMGDDKPTSFSPVAVHISTRDVEALPAWDANMRLTAGANAINSAATRASHAVRLNREDERITTVL